MTYKETIFFIGQSLTINQCNKNKLAIEKQLKESSVDWDAVVKVSTSHFVFPALYCNLKRANFLHYLPEDLVNYMLHITDLNRARNQKIIDQAKEINELLLANNITPIFLKGTGNLLEGLYGDIGERMVGDIDFIVAKEEYEKSVKMLLDYGYKKVYKDNYPEFKHYPRLHKKDDKSIAAIEIHKELLIEKYANEFNYEIIKDDIQFLNGAFVLSYFNQFHLSILAKQINDKGRHYKSISLRNTYDIFLLSLKKDPKKDISRFNKLFDHINCYIAVSHEVLGQMPSLKYTKNLKTNSYVKKVLNYLGDDVKRQKHFQFTIKKIFVLRKLEFIKKIFFSKEYREWILVRAKDKNWQNEKLIQLGVKKPKYISVVGKSHSEK